MNDREKNKFSYNYFMIVRFVINTFLSNWIMKDTLSFLINLGIGIFEGQKDFIVQGIRVLCVTCIDDVMNGVS